jgi:hypothetical protein
MRKESALIKDLGRIPGYGPQPVVIMNHLTNL